MSHLTNDNGETIAEYMTDDPHDIDMFHAEIVEYIGQYSARNQRAICSAPTCHIHASGVLRDDPFLKLWNAAPVPESTARFANHGFTSTFGADWAAIGPLTTDEFFHLQAVAGIAAETSSRLGCATIPGTSALRAINNLRHIRYLHPKPCTILDLAPGSGCLGLMLLALGYRYIGVEFSPPLYVWQAALYRAVTAPNSPAHCDFALSEDQKPFGVTTLSEALQHEEIRSISLPWWEWFRLASTKPVHALANFKNPIALVTASNILTSWNFEARAWTFHALHSFLNAQANFPTFLINGWGAQDGFTKDYHINYELYMRSFALAHNDGLATVYTPIGVQHHGAFTEFAAGYPPMLSPHLRPEISSNIVNMQMLYKPMDHSDPNNRISQEILVQRFHHKKSQTVSLEEVSAFYNGLENEFPPTRLTEEQDWARFCEGFSPQKATS